MSDACATARCRPMAAAVALLVALLWGIGGCTHVRDHLTLHADGSGSVAIDIVENQALAGFLGMRDAGPMGAMPLSLRYPPQNEADAVALFPGYEVETEEAQIDGQIGTRFVIAFEDINALLRTPYAQARSLVVEKDAASGRLTLRSLTGCGLLAAVQTMEPSDFDGPVPLPDQTWDMVKKAKVEFVFTLPGPAEADGATAVEGTTARWHIDPEAIGVGEPAAEALRQTLVLSCPADGLTFEPESPVRPAMLSFEEVPEGAAGSAADVDVERVKREAAFVPLELRMHRTIDYTGDAYLGEDGTVLSGLITVPADLRPHRYGEPELIEAVSSDGSSLLPDAAEEGYGGMGHFMGGMGMYGLGGGQSDGGHPIQLTMKVPPYGDTLDRVRAEVPLFYAGQPTIVKIADAVAPEDMPDEAEGMAGMFGGSGGSEGALTSDALAEHDIEATLSGVMRQGPLLVLHIEFESEAATIEQVYVYDREGRPWTTYSGTEMGMGEPGIQAVVAGFPEPPLSLALRVLSGGEKVVVPVELTDLRAAMEAGEGESE